MSIETLSPAVRPTFERIRRLRVEQRIASEGIEPTGPDADLFDDAELAEIAERAEKARAGGARRIIHSGAYADKVRAAYEDRRKRARSSAERGKLFRFHHLEDLADDFTDADELARLLAANHEATEAAAAREAQRKERQGYDAALAAEIARLEAEEAAKARTAREAKARKILGWPPQGYPDSEAG